ncbi:hypothetical protein ACSIGC_03160 [Tenacibaculum sp. ZS6-P6]|uniref:hypothetical protein n=1 Tax=Tenacibaculum sp. ZS6-P6 TaxID=3447503 RepID=UPI003F9E95CF
MNKILLILIAFLLLLLTSCNSIKSTQKAINSGDYEKAISLSINKLKKDKAKEKNQPYIIMLQEAYKKAVDKDLAKISFLNKENRPSNLRTIYNLYLSLNDRQERIKPLLPLKNLNTNKNVVFNLVNYDDQIIKVKEKYTEYLYVNAVSVFDKGKNNKLKYREAYQEFENINRMYPNYKELNSYMEEAHRKGIDYIFIKVFNETDQVIPRRLEDDLLAIDTYGLNDFWTTYHAKKIRNISYDFDLELSFIRIEVSPEQIKEKELIKEREIKTGYIYVKDDKGNYVKDSSGRKIKKDVYKTVRCTFYEYQQYKTSRVVGVVRYIDNINKQLLDEFPLNSEFVFEHFYADYDGDKRALEEDFFNLTKKEHVNFPSNEQMIYDTGSDIKLRLKNILKRNKFRD